MVGENLTRKVLGLCRAIEAIVDADALLCSPRQTNELDIHLGQTIIPVFDLTLQRFRYFSYLMVHGRSDDLRQRSHSSIGLVVDPEFVFV